MAREREKGILEALLFAAGDPVTTDQLMKILAKDRVYITGLVAALQRDLEARQSGLVIRRVAGGYQLVTRPEYFSYVEKLRQVTDRKLSTPAMETLSIIAFKQPITKQEIEQIRGVRVERSLAKLVELELVRECGRKHALGRPILYGTTELFLQCFGLNGLEDLPALPELEEVKAGLDEEQLRLFEGEATAVTADESPPTESE